jgi:hypothetical protein
MLAASSAWGEVRETTVFDAANRFLTDRFPQAKLVPSTTVIDSFENWEATKACWGIDERWVRAESVEEHATDGKRALKVTFLKPGDQQCRLRYIEGTAGWGSAPPNLEQKASLAHRIIFNDEVRLDVFNPGGPVKLGITMGKDFVVEIKPGANEIVLRISEMIPDVFRITGILPTTAFYPVDAADKEVALYLDNFRWVGPGVGENLLKNAKMFDFGWEYYSRPYFRNVDSTTGYTKERGFGWEKPNAVVFEYSKNMVTQTSSGRQPHDELLRDSVTQINTPFLVDLPDGRYRVHAVEGATIGWYSLQGSRYELTVVANGLPVLVRHAAKSVADSLRACYGLDQTDYEPGEDRFRKYFGPECHPLEFDVDVKGGQLKLEFKTDPFDVAQISFMIIYPVERAGAVEPEIAALWRDIAHRFNDVSYGPFPRKMAEQMHVPGLHEEYLDPELRAKKAAALKPAPIDQASGYVVFNREPTDEVYPDSVPSPEECGRAFAAFAPKGEIVSFAPALYALRDLEDAGLAVGDFVGPGGAKIGAERVDVRVVNCMCRMTSQQSHGDWRYVVMPWYLVKRDRVNVAAATSRRWWVNVDVPADAPPGSYVATASIRAKGTAAREVKLRLDVLPFTLDPVPRDVETTMYMGADAQWYGVPFRSGWRFAYSWRSSTPEGKAAMNAQIAEYAKAEKQYVKAEFDLLRKYGFNTVYYFRPDKDEVTPEVTAGFTVRDPEKEKATGGPVYRVEDRKRTYLYEVRRFNEESVSDQRKAGYDVELNWILQWEDVNQEAGLERFESGFLMWRLGAKGCVHNPWRCSWGNPYHPFDGHSGEWGSYCMPGSGPVPTLNSTMILEGAREGIQDYRWLVTLERLIKEKADTPAAAEARKALDALRARITPDARDYFQPVGRTGGWGQTWSLKDTAWRGAAYQSERRTIAGHIAALLGKKLELAPGR